MKYCTMLFDYMLFYIIVFDQYYVNIISITYNPKKYWILTLLYNSFPTNKLLYIWFCFESLYQITK